MDSTSFFCFRWISVPKKGRSRKRRRFRFFFFALFNCFSFHELLEQEGNLDPNLTVGFFFGSYLVLPSFLSRIPGFHNQNGLVPGRTGSWNTRTFRGLVPNWSRVPIIVTGFFFVVT